MLKPEMITRSQQVGVMHRRAYAEEEARMTIEEEEANRGLSRTQNEGFGVGPDGKRPSTAHMLPEIQPPKVASNSFGRSNRP